MPLTLVYTFHPHFENTLEYTQINHTYGYTKKIGVFFQLLICAHTQGLSKQHPIQMISVRQFSINQKEELIMLGKVKGTDLFYQYYEQWITVYKDGAIRKVTMDKYLMTKKWLEKLIPNLIICDLNRITYQQLLNSYAAWHERQTTMDFHHQLKAAILDAVDEGLIDRDPTRKAIIKGKTPRDKKTKYLNQFELHTLLSNLDLKSEVSWDWFILLVAKTGMRFSEALALTPKDFDFSHQMLSISKTWDYKGSGGFLPTKNQSSVRKVQIDWQTVIQFSELLKKLPEGKPIFTKNKVYNSTVNDILTRHCKNAKVPVISIHGLRHTHASLLLFAGVSIASVARRLGHASMTTTQKTYLHIIQELENKDVDLVMRSLSGLS
jgi:integrase